NKKPVRVVDWDREGLDKIVASLIYKKTFGEYGEIRRKLKAKSKKYKVDMLKKLLKNRTEYDRLPRDFEHIYISFDVLCDQGAYYDFKRNRMMTQIRQDLGVENGYMMPKMIKEVGMDKRYDEVIKRAENAYFEIRKKYPISAQYLVTKAHNRRFLMKMNLRELFYFVRLRARKAGNFAYRRIAMAILEEAKKKYPEIMKLFFEEKDLDSRGSIEKEFFYKFV
ncbi:FAD-dependent thymidylate synthase, partial [Patescibacteria group bacterium]|nr:FAD-dependent thymidylate synthase [Patescibacteria group bacterium]